MVKKHQGKHISELFKRGNEVPLKWGDEEVMVWMERPGPLQQDSAVKSARGVRARRKMEFRDTDGDALLSLQLEVEDLTRDARIDMLKDTQVVDHRKQAVNDVLYNEEVGSDWSEKGLDYTAILEAMSQRAREVEELNEAIPDGELRINLLEDPEFAKLSVEQEKFDKEVEERLETIVHDWRSQFDSVSDTDLQEQLVAKLIELECDSAWYQEYRTRMVWFSCRWSDDHKSLYFEDPSDILALPFAIQQRLFDAFDLLDVEPGDVKN